VTSDVHDAVEAVARRSYGKLVAFLAARTRDVAAAEDALSEAFAAALTDWPKNGSPSNPEGWLLTVARRKAIDALRRRQTSDRLAADMPLLATAPEEESEIPDERLGLLFTCAHPALDSAVHAPLMLQVVLGLDAKAIASAFLTSPAAMSKRLVRAKEKIRAAGIPFRVPERAELPERLNGVLAAVYAAFTEGWTDPSGTDPSRRDLASEALFLGRLVTELLPSEPEALGLLALLLHAEARRGARRDAAGQYVPLSEQDHSRWNWEQIAEAESLIRRAASFHTIGRYQLEAALQSAHVHRRRTGEANWGEIVGIYDALLAIAPSPVVRLNRAIAIGHLDGPAAALAILDDLADDGRLAQYQAYWAVRADVLSKCAAGEEARRAYDKAIGLERDPAVRSYLLDRRSRLD